MGWRWLAILAASVVIAADAPDDKMKRRMDELQGTWVLVAVQEAGESLDVPPEAQRKHLEICGDRIDTRWMDRHERGVFKLADGGTGLDIVPTDKGRERARPLECLYRIDHDLLLVAVPLSSTKGRPTTFESTNANDVVVQTFRRAKPREDVIPGAEEEQKKLEGSWQEVSCTENGEDISKPGETYCFQGNNTVTTNPEGLTEGEKRDGVLYYFLDPNGRPKHICLAPDGDHAMQGIYKLEGDTLTICTGVENKRPTEFTAKDGSDQMLMVLKRQRH